MSESAVPTTEQEPPLPRFGALGYANYRQFWLANVARVFGLQFRFIGAGWLTHLLTPSPVWLGIVGLAAAIPTIVLSVPAGTLADRFDNRKLLVWSQALTALCMFAMAFLVVAELATAADRARLVMPVKMRVPVPMPVSL